ncbi:MAG TPA: ribose-phosphate diphosphokinase [Gammaproteobacteria bacterium]|nr:ribose-phosphate diphosphokinase [Gammaproteobacteria bacterium]
MSDAQIIGFGDYAAQGKRLAAALGVPYAEAAIHIFPDGERKLRLPTPLAAHVIFCRSLNDPDHKLIELLLAAGSARDNGARRLTLVTPYLAYMRQDIAFHPGEAVSQRIIGKLLAQAFDAVITVDAHLHRIDHLAQAIPLAHAINLSATGAMGDFIAHECPDALLLGPDGESEQWVAAVAAAAGGLDYGVATKTRRGDRDVSIDMPGIDFHGRRVVLVDDVASTGRTLALAAHQARAAGASSAHCLVTHGLFVGDALAALKDAGVDKVWSTDSVTHPSNRIELAGLLAGAVRGIY